MMLYPMIDPIAISIGPLNIRWYALAYIAGIVLGWQLIMRIQRNGPLWGGTAPFTHEQADDLMIWATLGIVLGGRIGYVLFYNLPYYIENPEQIYQIWQGGMAFHGGLMGLILAIYIFSRKHIISFLGLMDAVALAAPIGLFFGRIANFINAELWGRVTTSPFGMIFPNAGDLPRHPSQLYQAGLEGIILFAILAIAAFKFNALQKRGHIAALFLIFYGIARIIGECFREPDPQLGFIYETLTMGMILSVPMVALGIFLLLQKPSIRI